MTGTVRIREIAEVNPSVPEFHAATSDAEVTFVPLECVWPGARLDLSRVRPKAEVESGYARFREGDVLVPKVTPTFQAARSALAVGVPCQVGAASTEVYVVRPRPGTDPRYLTYAFHTKDFLDEGVSAFQGVAGLQRVTDMFLRDFRVLDQSLAKQRRIADFLDDQVARIDEIIRLREEQVSAVETRYSTAIDDVTTGLPSSLGGLPAKRVPFAAVPVGWAETKLRYLRCVVQTGPFGSQLHSDEYIDEGGWPLVNPAGITQDGLVAVPGMAISEENRSRLSRHILKEGDVVFGRRGELGRAGLVTGKQVGWVCGTGSLLVRTRDSRLLPAYLFRLLRTRALKQYFEVHSVGSTMSNLNTEIVLSMPLLLPPVAIQEKIALKTQKMDAVKSLAHAEMRAQIKLLQERKRSLITAAVTGEFDVSTASGRGVA